MAAAAFRLPQFIVVKPLNQVEGYNNAYYKKNKDTDGGILDLGSETEFSIFSQLVKIEAERATSDDKYVNLRFCSSNRYWQQDTEDSSFVSAVLKEPVEDTADGSCTLFEPFSAGDENGPNTFYLKHVCSGLTLSYGQYFYLSSSTDTRAYLTYLDWDTLVKLPAVVALKGDNGMYLQPYIEDAGSAYMRFSGKEYNDQWSVFNVLQMPDGHVQLFSSEKSSDLTWVSYDNCDWILLVPTGAQDDGNLFWPIKVDSGTIVLRNKKTGSFCMRSTSDAAEGTKDWLASTGSTMMAATKLQVEEPTLDRKIYYVNYMMEDARIFDEQPYLAGSSVIVNATDFPTSESVTITYQDQKSYSFSRGFSITAGLSTEIKAGLPFLAEGKIQVSLSLTGSFQWDTTTTTTTTVSATGTVDVPARSSVVMDYVGTQGSCNIPYGYTQLDKSATDGKIKRTEMVDGTYTGVSCYDFSFKMSAPKATTN